MGKIVITVKPKGGAVAVRAEGIKGAGCEPLVAGLSAKIRGTRGVEASAEHTPEFYEQPEAERENR